VLTGKALFKPPFQWREFILQSWFLFRVAFLPTLAVSIPLTVLLIFTLNILLAEFGAADISGAGAALGAVTQLGPLVTVLVVAGAGSTAICADLGARTIREEIDALEVLGIDPIHRLVVPRVVASTFVAVLLNGAVITIGLVGGFIFGVYLQNVSAGAYVSTLTLVTGLPEVLISIIKAGTFGLIAGLVGCYRGLTVSGGAKGVGTAVNETLVLCVIALFAVNVVLTTIGVRFGELTCPRPRSCALGSRGASPAPKRLSVRQHASSTASGMSPGSSSRRSVRSGTRRGTTARRCCG
jgi:phospholipid/cholesterol/gamma-HCH transport system permease protein